MSGHTPGPWVFELDDDYTLVFVQDYLPGKLVVAEVFDQPETEANARLIAAAPELLAALKKCEGLLADADLDHEPNDDEGFLALQSARAAIAKAEGRA